jgi:hypothetical protein
MLSNSIAFRNEARGTADVGPRFAFRDNQARGADQDPLVRACESYWLKIEKRRIKSD